MSLTKREIKGTNLLLLLLLFCWLTSVVVCNAAGVRAGRTDERSARRGGRARGRPTLHGRLVVLRPVRPHLVIIIIIITMHWKRKVGELSLGLPNFSTGYITIGLVSRCRPTKHQLGKSVWSLPQQVR